MISSPETLLFKFLDYLPLSGVTGLVSLVVISLFFITSADSGIYVLNNIASRDKSLVAPRWQAVMWGVLMSVVAIVLMQSGGWQPAGNDFVGSITFCDVDVADVL